MGKKQTVKYRVIPDTLMKDLVEFIDEMQFEASKTNTTESHHLLNLCNYLISCLINSDSFTDGTFGGNFSIGAHGDATSTTYALDGYMSNVGIWTRELNQPEVKSIMWKSYSDLSTDDVASLQGWYNLDVDASDSHSTENDGVFR